MSIWIQRKRYWRSDIWVEKYLTRDGFLSCSYLEAKLGDLRLYGLDTQQFDHIILVFSQSYDSAFVRNEVLIFLKVVVTLDRNRIVVRNVFTTYFKESLACFGVNQNTSCLSIHTSKYHDGTAWKSNHEEESFTSCSQIRSSELFPSLRPDATIILYTPSQPFKVLRAVYPIVLKDIRSICGRTARV